MRRFVFAAVMAGLLAACGEGTSYSIPAKDVTSKLLATKPPSFVFGSSGANVMVTQGDGGAVRWTVFKGGQQAMRLVATVVPDGDNASRVTVSVEPPNNDANSTIGKNMADNPAIVKLYKAAMIEQIDAKLNNREFNSSAIQGEMMAAAVATMPKMQASLNEAVKNSAEMESRMKQRAADAAYERERSAAMSGYSSDSGSYDSSSY